MHFKFLYFTLIYSITFYRHLGKDRLVYRHVKGSQYWRRRRTRGNNSRYGRFVLLDCKTCATLHLSRVEMKNRLRFHFRLASGSLCYESKEISWKLSILNEWTERAAISWDQKPLLHDCISDSCIWLVRDIGFLSGKSQGNFENGYMYLCNHVVKLWVHVAVTVRFTYYMCRNPGK